MPVCSVLDELRGRAAGDERRDHQGGDERRGLELVDLELVDVAGLELVDAGTAQRPTYKGNQSAIRVAHDA